MMNRPYRSADRTGLERTIAQALKTDCPPPVPQSEIDAACKSATAHYREKQRILDAGFWRVVFYCRSAWSLLFWIVCAFLLGSCAVMPLLFGTDGRVEPAGIVTAISPVPVITFALRELRRRDGSLADIERTCKYTPDRIYFARLWLGMLLNAGLVAAAGAVAFSGHEYIARLYLCSFSAMFFVGAAALLLLSLTRSILPLSIVLSAWVVCSVWLMSGTKFSDMIARLNVPILAAFTLLGAGAFAAATILTRKKLRQAGI